VRVRAGDLRYRVTIERDASTTRPSGGIKAWATPATVCEVAAAIVFKVGIGDERINQESVSAVKPCVIWIRWRNDIDEKMRVKYVEPSSGRTKYYQIRSAPLTDRREQFMPLTCEEVA